MFHTNLVMEQYNFRNITCTCIATEDYFRLVLVTSLFSFTQSVEIDHLILFSWVYRCHEDVYMVIPCMSRKGKVFF